MDEGPEPSANAAEPNEEEIARLAEERARLQAEVDELRGQLAAPARRSAGRPRLIVTGLLVVLTSLLVTVAVAGVWARRNALNTDRWVETVGPIAEDPAVHEALGRWMTDELMAVIDLEALFESVLPDRGQILAVPLTSAVRGVRQRRDR